MRRLVIVVILASFSMSCWWAQTPKTPQPPVRKFAPASTLGPGDLLEIKVFDEKDLSGVYRVSSSGAIDFPLVGLLQVNGLTGSDAAALLEQMLKKNYLRDPQVSLFIKEYNSKKISVFGQVTKPGTFKYEDGMSVIQAVSMAGGFTKMASKDNTNVTRLVDGQEKKYPIPVESIARGEAKNFFLQPGDIVYVPESIW